MDKELSLIIRIGLLIGLLTLSGCYEAEQTPEIVGEHSPLRLPPAEAPLPMQRIVGRSVQGRPLAIQILGDGPETVFVLATIHGSEPAGTPLVNLLTEYLRRDPAALQGRRVVLMPVANPDGLAARTRENVRGIDLNRNFEADNRVDNEVHGYEALSEPESRALQKTIVEYRPARIVSIHQPLNCIDYDGPGRALAARMAQYCDLPVKKLGARPGSLGAYTGDHLGIPTITLEMPAEASRFSDAALWQKYGRALLAAIAYPEHAK